MNLQEIIDKWERNKSLHVQIINGEGVKLIDKALAWEKVEALMWVLADLKKLNEATESEVKGCANFSNSDGFIQKIEKAMKPKGSTKSQP